MPKSPLLAASPVALDVGLDGAQSNVDSRLKLAAGQLLGGIAGRAGSPEALRKVQATLHDDRKNAARPTLMKAVRAINAGNVAEGKDLALKGLAKDEHSGFGWYLLGMALEMGGDFANSLRAYEAALKLLPDHTEVAHDLGRLAFRMGMKDHAEKLFRHFLSRNPKHAEALNNLATVVRDGGRYDEAIELLRPALLETPNNALLWNTMGTIVGEQGDLENAMLFFVEAVRVDPSFSRAVFNLSNIQQLMGDVESALENCEAALAEATLPSDQAMMRMARFNCMVSLGRLEEGWADYEARLDPQFAGVTLFQINRPPWRVGADLAGKTLLVSAEQGLGDEILFGTVLPDVVKALGPDGKLIVGVERRLVSLFQRSFPDAEIYAHKTYDAAGRAVRIVPVPVEDHGRIDLWAPMASLLREYRSSHESFPTGGGYLKADPGRVQHWREVLRDAPPGPKIGLLWKSATTKGARHRFFSPLEQWRPILSTPGASFINLQYGDCEEDLAYIRKNMGVEVWQPPGIDLKADLDEVAALSCALDLTLGFSNATFNIAAACGAPTWLIIGVSSWPRLGLKDRYPWYPQTRMFAQEGFGDWDNTMGRIGVALREWVGERQAA